MQEKELKKIEECFAYKDTPPITWINIDGLHDVDIIEKIGKKIELLEEDLLDDTQTETRQSIHHLKREMIFFRKQVWPIRDILSILMKGETSLIQEATRIFIRDLYDHTIQVMDTIESVRDVLSGLQDCIFPLSATG